MKKLLLSSLICATVLFAQNSDYNYEITPMVGGIYSEGNLGVERSYGNAGLSIGLNLDDSMFDQVELGFLTTTEDINYNGNNGETSVTRVFTNLIKEYDFWGRYYLYSLIGIGYEDFEEEKLGNENSAFGNYGFGIKYKVDHDLAIKADVRHLIETDHGDNNLVYTLGLAFSFGKKAMAAPEKAPEPEPKKVVLLDSDNDGVYDDKDECPNTPAGAEVDEVGCAVKINLHINFDTNSAVIKPEYDETLESFVHYLTDYKNKKATIEAHTDSSGSDSYNQKLSERRAASTVEALIQKGIAPERLDSVGYGEQNPVISNDTPEAMAENRRVQAIIKK